MKVAICPVCTGSGIVDEGFYRRTSNTWTNSGGSEKCRSCDGTGWIEIRENAEESWRRVDMRSPK